MLHVTWGNYISTQPCIVTPYPNSRDGFFLSALKVNSNGHIESFKMLLNIKNVQKAFTFRENAWFLEFLFLLINLKPVAFPAPNNQAKY